MAESFDGDFANYGIVVGGDVVFRWIDRHSGTGAVPVGRRRSEGDSDTAYEHQAQNRDCFLESWAGFHFRFFAADYSSDERPILV